MTEPAARRHTEVIKETVSLRGRRVLDIGCGDGALASWMRKQGALLLAVETDPVQRERARKALGAEAVLEGRGEALPLPDASRDLLLYFNSFHHVPVHLMDRALAEASRVTAPGGELLVIEPVAQGDYFELLRPIEDETDIRAAALRALEHASSHGFHDVQTFTYLAWVKHASAEAMMESFRKANPGRATALERERAGLVQAFERLGEADPEGNGRRFKQPFHAVLLRLV